MTPRRTLGHSLGGRRWRVGSAIILVTAAARAKGQGTWRRSGPLGGPLWLLTHLTPSFLSHCSQGRGPLSAPPRPSRKRPPEAPETSARSAMWPEPALGQALKCRLDETPPPPGSHPSPTHSPLGSSQPWWTSLLLAWAQSCGQGQPPRGASPRSPADRSARPRGKRVQREWNPASLAPCPRWRLCAHLPETPSSGAYGYGWCTSLRTCLRRGFAGWPHGPLPECREE